MRSAISSSITAVEPPLNHVKSATVIQDQGFSSVPADGGGAGGLEFTNIQKRPGRAAIWAASFQEAELNAVRIATRSAKSPVARFCAVCVTKLGNGWLYPLLAVPIFVRWGLLGYRIVVMAAINAALIHSLYPVIKRRFRRMRPYEVDPRLPCLLATLDEHSFPSGHTMTLTGVLIPIVLLWPAMSPWAVLIGFCIAWSRMATAHHYPSDVFAGVVLGAGVSYPISAWVAHMH